MRKKNKAHKVLLIFLSFMLMKVSAGDLSLKREITQYIDAQNPDEWKKSSEQIVKFLESEKITKIETLEAHFRSQGRSPSFTTLHMKIITFSNGQKAIFKPIKSGDCSPAVSEIAAFRASVFLKFPYVPPTCLRTIGSETGSLQLFVEGAEPIKTQKEFVKVLRGIDREQIAATKIFAFVMGQWDTSYENFLIKSYKKKMYLISIDNGNIWQQQFGCYGKLPFVLLGPPDSSLPSFGQIYTLMRPTIKSFEPFKKELLPLTEKLLTQILKRRMYCFRFTLCDGRIWRQYYADPDFNLNKEALYDTRLGVMPAYVPQCFPALGDSLKKLTLEYLENIFDVKISSKCSFRTKPYFQNILKRPDDVLNHQQILDV